MNTKSIILFALISLLIVNQTQAQVTIDGTVTDADLNPINDALVQIIDENDSTNIYSSNTNEQGYFSISAITGIETNLTQISPNYIVLSNYPNPFNPTTVIYFELPKADNIEITIYDILGREVRALYNAFHEAGSGQIIWDGMNNRNSHVAAGIYLCRLKTKDMFKVHKMVLLDGGSSSFLGSNKRVLKSNFQKPSNTNSIFNFRLRVTGNDILETEFRYLTCSKDTTVNLMVPSILQSATIGSEGGKLETEGFSLTIPEGAFSENVTLNLALSPNLDESFSTAITKVYRIDKFPNLYSKPLNIRMKCICEYEDSVFIGLGYKSIDPTTGNDGVSFNICGAKDSSGFIVAILPASNNGTSQSLLKSTDFLPLKGKLFLGLAGYGAGEDSEHFSFFSREQKYISLSYPIVESAEKAFNDFCNILRLDKIEFWNKYKQHSIGSEIDIYAYKSLKLNNERPHRYCVSYLSKMKDEITKNLNLEFDLHIDDSKVSQSNLDYLLRDLYHYIYFLFPFNQYTNNYESANQFWLHHAIAAWSEELYSTDNFISPLDFNLHYKIPFNGIQSFLETSPSILESHGIGMSALIKHLTKAYGNNIVGKFFNGLKTNPNALEVILDTLNYVYNTPESIWWPDFFKEYISGNIYNIQGEKFLNNITKTIEFNDGDTLKYIDETYKDLSAKLFRININSMDIKNNKSLYFQLGPPSLNLDYVKALVFGITGNNLTFLSEGIEFSVGNLSEYDGLFTCVVNSGNESPYTGTSEINLEIKTHKIPDAILNLDFNWVDIHIETQADYKHYDGPQTSGPFSFSCQDYQHSGAIESGIFTATWDETFWPVTTTEKGYIEIVLDTSSQDGIYKLKNISIYDINSSVWSSYGNLRIRKTEIRGNSVNLLSKSFENNILKFEISGNSTCEYLDYIISDDRVDDESWWHTLSNWYCNNYSYIIIEFQKK